LLKTEAAKSTCCAKPTKGSPQFRAPVFALLLGKQADPGFPHRGTHWSGSMSKFYRARSVLGWVFRGGLKAGGSDVANFTESP
jgi:hypothetical protein